MERGLEELEKEREELEKKLSSAELLLDREALKETATRFKEVRERIHDVRKKEDIRKRREEAEHILRETGDETLKTLAREELESIAEEEKLLVQQGAPHAKSGARNMIVEIRPGTGGEEAALFASDLLRMYLRFAEKKGWKVAPLEEHAAEAGGTKLAIFEIAGKGVDLLRFESGVHRVQRIPETERMGRVHTSAATVAVLPKPDTSDITIDPGDLFIETMRASGPGGQLVNRRESAVRITHKPSGIAVTSQTARTQVQNRDNAMAVLRARLFERKRQEEETRQGATRLAQIGSGDRSEKIRTYNFPQDRLTDHRIKKSWHHLEAIMNGGLEEILNDLARADSD